MKQQHTTEEQKAAALARRDALKKIACMVSEMTPDQRRAMVHKFGAIVNCEGRALSEYNSIFVLSQAQNASMLGGFRQWRKVGRKVRKGAKALAIWIPTGSSEENTEAAADLTVADVGQDVKSATMRPRFRLVWVFDILQTIGEGEIETAPLLLNA